jgi:hypothetical protein
MEEKLASVMDVMPYGLYVIGSRSEDDDGMMADWVMQVSFQPRLIAVAFENDARTLQNIRASGVFREGHLRASTRGPGASLPGLRPDREVRGFPHRESAVGCSID